MEQPGEEKPTAVPTLQSLNTSAQNIAPNAVSTRVASSDLPVTSEPTHVISTAIIPDNHWRAVTLLTNKTWLKNTFHICRIFAADCVVPAIVLTVGGLAMTTGQYYAVSQIHPTGTELINILSAIGTLLVTMIVTLIFFVWGFTLWLVRLSTFSHAFCALDMCAATLPDTAQIKTIFASSHTFILSRKKYFGRFYLLISLLMIAPVFIWMTLFTIKAMTMSKDAAASAMKIVLPPAVDIVGSSLIAVLGGYLVGISLISVVVSSVSRENANVAAWDCMKLSFSRFLPMIVLVIVVGIVNTVIATPQMCLHPFDVISLGNTKESLPASLCSELWEGITSVILFTLTLAPFCELLRVRLK